jgi:ABC-type multidrug transport system ATPase subunit
MDLRVVLSKIVTLIYRSRLIDNLDNDDLVRTILNTIRSDAPEVMLGGSVLKKLKELCIELLDEKELIAKEVLLPRVHLILDTDQKLYNVIKESIDPEYEDTTNKRVCTSLIKTLNTYYREHLATEMLNKAAYDLKFNRGKIANFTDYLKGIYEQIEPLTTHSNIAKDPAILNEISFQSSEDMERTFEEMRVSNSDTGIYKFGWQDFNIMTQGGIRRGENMTIGALQHKYKSGFLRSLFTQIACHNTPIVYEGEEGKKPLLLYISFEDPTHTNVQFIYQYLKMNEGIKITKRELQEIPIKEAAAYVTEYMTRTGFHIDMLRVDPTRWDYRAVMNKVIEYEAKGYVIHGLLLDYITMQFGAKPLFEKVSVKFGDGNRYGLIGANGCGKSTFMKILGGDLEPTQGTVSIENGLRLGKLRQDQFAYEEQRVIDVVLQGHVEMWAAMSERDAIYANLEATEDDYMRAAELEGKFAEYDGYTAEARAGELLMGVGIPVEQHFGPMSEVAPGWKLRVLLAQALFSNPDILLLDEPTNNLDINTIRWLENTLNQRNSTMIIISHDRHFLNSVCTHMADVDYGEIRIYPGN